MITSLCALAGAFLAHASLAAADSPIKHVIVVELENRSFDHLFGWLTKNNTQIDGLTGTQGNPIDPTNPSSPFILFNALADDVTYDPDHSVEAVAQQIYGTQNIAGFEHNQTAVKMNGFIAASYGQFNYTTQIMDAFEPSHIPVMTTLAMNFVVGDRFFASVPGSTFPNRLFSQSATSYGYSHNSLNQTLYGFPQPTMFERLDEVNVTWKVYFTDVSTAWLFNYMRTPAALSKTKSMDTFYADCASGDLPSFAWLDPRYYELPLLPAEDQHPPHDVVDGERFIKKVYEALRASPAWNETVLIITYDEHGGFPDHVPALASGVPNPDGIACRDCGVSYNFTRGGVRIPFVAVSPYIPKTTIMHTPDDSLKPFPTSQYESASIPATVHSFFKTKSFLNNRDAWAVPFDHLWTQSPLTEPRTDCPMTLPDPPVNSPVYKDYVRDGSHPLTSLHTDLLHIMVGLEAHHELHPDAVEAAQSEAKAAEYLFTKLGLDTELKASNYIRNVIDRVYSKHGLTY